MNRPANAPRSAQRVIFAARDRVELETVTVPGLGPDQVLIETRYSAISPGTELAFLLGKPNTPGEYPIPTGYSLCARIVKTGHAVTELAVGQTVVCNAPHASHVVVAAARCTPLPDGVDPIEAAAYRLASIALQGVRKAEIQLGWDVAVLGLGPIGNLAAQLARLAGAAGVEGIDPVAWRRDLARQSGCDAVAASAETAAHAGHYQAVIESTGVPDALPQAFRLAGRLGRVVLLGSTRGVTEGVNFYADVHKKGLTIVGAHESIRATGDDFGVWCGHMTDERTVIRLLAAQRLSLRPIVSGIVSATDAATAYRRLIDRKEPLMTLILQWTDH